MELSFALQQWAALFRQQIPLLRVATVLRAFVII